MRPLSHLSSDRFGDRGSRSAGCSAAATAAGAKQTVESLRLQLDEVVKERDANRGAAQDLRRWKPRRRSGNRAFEERLAEMTAAKEALSAQFAEVGSKLLEGAQKQFLERADQRFRQSEENCGQQSQGACSSRSTSGSSVMRRR